MEDELAGYEIEEEWEREAIKELMHFHETMSEKNRKYLSDRGFVIIEDSPTSQTERPFVAMSNDGLKGGVFYGKRGTWSEDSSRGPMCVPDVTLQPVSSLVGLVERSLVGLKDCWGTDDIAEAPAGKPFPIFLMSEEYRQIADILVERYPAKKD